MPIVFSDELVVSTYTRLSMYATQADQSTIIIHIAFPTTTTLRKGRQLLEYSTGPSTSCQNTMSCLPIMAERKKSQEYTVLTIA